MKDHLGPKCPGAAYFERKDKKDKEEMREIFREVVGDVPRYMKIAGENRVWLYVLSLGLLVTGIILLII